MLQRESMPSHISPQLVYDFDYRAIAGANDDIFVELKKLQEKPAIFWTRKNGGHWVITRGQYIQEILANSRDFSSRSVAIPVMSRAKFLPAEADANDFKALRQFTNKLFSPDSIARATEDARWRAQSQIDRIYSLGHCEFMSEFADKISLPVFLKMCGLEPKDHSILFDWYKNPTPTYIGDLERHFIAYAAQRREHPNDDFMSRLVQSDINGRKLTDSECASMAIGIILGALDTVANSLGWMIYFLGKNPGHRQQLIDEPQLMQNAIHELLRRFSVSSTARIVANDTVFHEVEMRAGDPVSLLTCMQGLDESIFENAMTVDFSRKNADQHLAFSRGAHSCPGQNLALAEIRVFLEEWLQRIPHYEINGHVHAGVKAIIFNIFSLPIRWPTTHRDNFRNS